MNGRPGALISTYRAATALIAPLTPALIAWRRRKGKEDPRRLQERLGIAARPRPPGRLAWLHGASVGEGLALLPLVERLVARGIYVLLTTGTVTSAAILANRLPGGALHQFIPLDVARFMARFLDHWRPDIVLIAESELWPNLLIEVKARTIPLVLVNARLSQRSFDRWLRFPSAIATLLSHVDLCLAQSHDDAQRLAHLGAPRVSVAGNLKYDVPAPPADAARVAELNAAIGARPVWLAASTHPGEEDIIAKVHRTLLATLPTMLTIVVPRRIARGPEIATIAASQGLTTGLRSRGDDIDRTTQFYVADTMGELGLFYRLSAIVFVGKSLAGPGGGQNPIEPAKLGAAVLHGPKVANFAEVYRTIDAANGAFEVRDSEMLARVLGKLLADPALLRKMARAAGEAVEGLGGATNTILQALDPYFMQMQLEKL